jgi:hypothetical protein
MTERRAPVPDVYAYVVTVRQNGTAPKAYYLRVIPLYMPIDGRTVTATLGGSLLAFVLVSYAVTAAGAPLSVATESVDGVHLEAEYIEGSSVDMVPKFNAVDGCNKTIAVSFHDAKVSGVRMYAELPKPIEGGVAEVGFELDTDDYHVGSLQLMVSRLGVDGEQGFGGTLSAGEDGFIFEGDEEFRLENVTTHVYGFGSGWLNAPFVRTGYEPDAETVESYRC